MIIEKIPKAIKLGNQTINLRTEDLPKDANGKVMWATFESMSKGPTKTDNMGLVVILGMKQGVKDGNTGMWEEVDNTAIRVIFKGGKFRTPNARLTMMLLTCSGYKKAFTIDGGDPSGLWRSQGAIEVEMKPVIMRSTILPPDAKDIDFKKCDPDLAATEVENKDGEKELVVEPVTVIG